ncbi:ABC transporter permease [Pseudomonadota bacterium]
MLVVFQDAVKQTVVFALMFVFLMMLGVQISWAWLGVVPVILTQFLFICGIAMVVAAITPFLPDFVYLVATAMTMLMFGSGIFYNCTDVLLPEHQELFLMNPVASLIMNYRQVLMDNLPPDWGTLSTISIASIALILIMTVFYRRYFRSHKTGRGSWCRWPWGDLVGG